MVTTIDEYNKQLNYVIDDIKNRMTKINKINPPHFQTYNMDKPIYVLTANVKNYIPGLVDKGDHYEMMYPRFGDLQKSYTNNFCWIIDDETVFIIERPFKNRVIKALKRLLPNNKIYGIKNDVMIDGYKIGPTCMAGPIEYFGDRENPESGSLIYCLRWTNVEGLDKYFAGDPNHEARKNGEKYPLGQLDKFITNMTRLEFMKYIEEFED